MVSGSLKGAEWEREAAKALSLWMTGGKDKSQLARSRASGGWQTGTTGKDGWRHAGDLAPNGPEGERFRRAFIVECKHAKGIDLWHVFTSPKSEWLTWLPKLELECEEWGLCPWLMIKPHGKGIYVLVPTLVLDQFEFMPTLTLGLPGCNFVGVLPWKEVQEMGTAAEWIQAAKDAGYSLRSSE